MPKKSWRNEAEKFLMEEWHSLIVNLQGKMYTKQEREDFVTKKKK